MLTQSIYGLPGTAIACKCVVSAVLTVAHAAWGQGSNAHEHCGVPGCTAPSVICLRHSGVRPGCPAQHGVVDLRKSSAGKAGGLTLLLTNL